MKTLCLDSIGIVFVKVDVDQFLMNKISPLGSIYNLSEKPQISN